MEKDYQFLDLTRREIEEYLCARDGVDEEAIRVFTERFNKMKEEFPDLVGHMESGDHADAPHNKQHKIAVMMEKWLADNMQIDYEQYQKTIYS